jgi:hypothetical protein
VLAAGCGGDEEKPPPGLDDVEVVTRSVASIVFHCRSVEQGYLASVDEQVLRRDVDALAGVAGKRDPDAAYRVPESSIERKTTMRDQVELAARLLADDCSPGDAEKLRDALAG